MCCKQTIIRSSIFFLFIIPGITATAQVNSNAHSFIREIYQNWRYERPYLYKDCDTFFYTDKLDTAIIGKMLKSFETDKEYKRWIPSDTAENKDKTRFTLEERKYIIEQLNKLRGNGWQPHMFQYAHLIPAEKLQQLLKQTDQEKFNPEKKICMEVYTFSRPFFLRNNSLCFFYLGKSNIFTSSGECWIYRMENGTWNKLALVYEWAAIN